ncbi:transcription initiation factor TFIID subunit 4-like [Acipenser oxyrinchus oxyrinchus]|uniref:Transcription initiation factor TFIID subunit 4-like n=1 Tax=Acipenser oxyrinchus oxyrinchus TaxID=40147 RepID=A0AAD8GEC3_ACIOX|nr:transcription initiation factor TFIID subunit 4-like [Acipenser oxyrinchus oxyrinchus]
MDVTGGVRVPSANEAFRRMPASDASNNHAEVTKIQPKSCNKIQSVNGGNVSVNAVSCQSSGVFVTHGITGHVHTNSVALSTTTDPNEVKAVSNGQTSLISAAAMSDSAPNNQTFALSSCKPQTVMIVPKSPGSIMQKSVVISSSLNRELTRETNILNTSANMPASLDSTVPKIVVHTSKPGASAHAIVSSKPVQESTTMTSANSHSSVVSHCQPLQTVNVSGQASVGKSLAPASQTGMVTTTTSVASTSKVTRVGAITQTPGKGTVLAVPRVSTPQQNGTPQAPQTTTIQLPANFKIPQGMVLIRSDRGQLMLVSQQALAQAQGAGLPRPAATTPALRASTPKAAATTTLRKQESATIVKNQTQQISPAVTSVQRIPVVKTTGIAVSATSVQTVRPPAPAAAPTTAEGSKGKSVAQSTVTSETVENAKKCKNFLVTLIKLASSGTHSAEMAKNVKELVRNLLDAKIEPEEFTNRLYTELKSSPQPYLVPFLKKSLPAVRQLTPNSQLFIQQCVLQKDGIVSTAAIAAQHAVKQTSVTVVANSKTIEHAELAQPVKPAQPPKPAQMIVQQPRGVVIKPPASIAQSQQSTQIVNRIQFKTPVTTTVRSNLYPAGTVVKQAALLGPKAIRVHFKENGAALFRDEDDINDVASMAGVNLNEENARILATNSELVGSVIRSCRDEPFLLTSALQKKILETGNRHDITEVNPDVVSLVSHATQERLRTLVEKMTVASHHRTRSYKDDSRNLLLNDTRSQLKFFEQLDRLEKQRKDEEEREMLLRAAKSRSNKEDPDQLRLKQKAKEMQQLELAEMQQRDANRTALAAIGPRKKRPLDSLGYGSGSETIGHGDVTGASQSAIPKQFSRLRTTRASLKDLIFCMEQEQAMRQSITLYRAFLK